MPRSYSLVFSRLSAVILATLSVAGGSVGAESPADGENSTQTAKQEHGRPQIIYHLPAGSHPTAQALHAQSKAAEFLEIGPDMPISLQLARASANEAARAEAAASRRVEATPGSPSKNGEPSAKRTKSRRVNHSNRARNFPKGGDVEVTDGHHGEGHGRGHGNGHGH